MLKPQETKILWTRGIECICVCGRAVIRGLILYCMVSVCCIITIDMVDPVLNCQLSMTIGLPSFTYLCLIRYTMLFTDDVHCIIVFVICQL